MASLFEPRSQFNCTAVASEFAPQLLLKAELPNTPFTLSHIQIKNINSLQNIDDEAIYLKGCARNIT